MIAVHQLRRRQDDHLGATARCAVSKPEQLRKHVLECLRLESDCMQLAARVSDNGLRTHFVRMAQHWSTLAALGSSADASHALVAGEMQTT